MTEIQEHTELVEVYALPALARAWVPMSCAQSLIDSGRCRLAPALREDGRRSVADAVERTLAASRP